MAPASWTPPLRWLQLVPSASASSFAYTCAKNSRRQNGDYPSHPIFTALDELLKARSLRIKRSSIQKFLDDVDGAAPWFAVSGSLTGLSWEKLGKDLHVAEERGELSPGTKLLWGLIRECLTDGSCTDAIEKGQEVLEQFQEKYSEKSDKEASGSAIEGPRFRKGRGGQLDGERGPLEGVGLPPSQIILPPYPGGSAPPLLGDTTLHKDTWRWVRAELACPIFPDVDGQRMHEPLDFKIVKNLAESIRFYGPAAPYTQSQVETLTWYAMTPTDWNNLCRACLSPGQYLDWRAFLIEFANEQAAANHWQGHAGWDRDMLLRYGQHANQQTTYPDEVFGQINQIAIKAWKSLPNRGKASGNLTKIVQGPTEPFSDFVARMLETCERTFADINVALPLVKQLVYEQCSKDCRTAITPIKDKGLEDWMKICREIGGPLTNTGLAAAMMQLTKARPQSQSPTVCFKCGQSGHMCRHCPQWGNVAPGEERSQQPSRCPRCRKGNHWASECRSVKDIDGRPLSLGHAEATRLTRQATALPEPKYGQRGPRPQGPKIYGAISNQDPQGQAQWQSLRRPADRGEPLQVPRDWTSVPPPDSY
ncbi:endogenous retrovirus group K member 24 Gag polyprotein-like [Rhynchocyon petersi]